MTSVGIDKILLTTKDFIIESGHYLTVQPMAFQPNSKDAKEEPVLFNDQRGQKAYLNTSNFNVSISPIGLSIQFNPSKALHPYNLTNDNEEIKQVWDYYRGQIKDSGILLAPDNELKLSRFDMAKNHQMNYPIQFYAPVFQSLKGKRMEKKEFPNSHYFANQSREINFYDKTEEVNQRDEKIQIDERLMRAELRAKNTDTVRRIYRFNSFEGMIKAGSEYRENKLKDTLCHQIFSEGNRMDQLEIFTLDYDKELSHLKMIKSNKGRNSIFTWISVSGLEGIIDRFGNLENIRLFLIDAGYEPKYTFRVIKDMRNQLQYSSFFQTKDRNQNLTSLYNELLTKFAS